MGQDADYEEYLAYMIRLAELERDPAAAKATLVIGPYTAMILIGVLQQATRHPDMWPAVRTILLRAVDQLKPLFAGTPGEEIIKRGEHPEWDR